MEQVKSILIVFILIALINGCHKNPVTAQETNTDLVPLSIGNTWSVCYTEYDTNGVVVGTPRSTTDTYTISKDTTILGKVLYKYFNLWCINSDSGLVKYNTTVTNGVVKNSFKYIYPYPTQKGNVYDNNDIVVTAIDTGITVPAGTVQCIEYKFYDSGVLAYQDYVSRGIGLVKEEMFNLAKPAKVQVVLELTSYKINAPQPGASRRDPFGTS
ncbi:MAG: hypothetical protein ABSC53_03005 [Bacteroidota bacterium]